MLTQKYTRATEKLKHRTSTSFRPFVYLKFCFWTSPSFRSGDFSAAEHPSSRRASDQWYGQWYLMLLQSEGVYLVFKSTIARKRSLITPWYRVRSVFRTANRSGECTSSRRLCASPILARVLRGSKGVVDRYTCRCRAIATCQPPLMRRSFRIQLVTPCGKVLQPSLPPTSTFLFGGVRPATSLISYRPRDWPVCSITMKCWVEC